MRNITACLFLLCMGAPAFGLTLGDLRNAHLVLHPEATKAETYAAQEFASLFQEATQTALPLVSAPEAGRLAIFVGPDAVIAGGGAAPATDLQEEGLHIQITPEAVYIHGGRPRGTLYGVYEFFEEYGGVRFLTHDHTYFPPDFSTRELPVGIHQYMPPFAFRWSYYGETRTHREFATRLRNNTLRDEPRLGGRTAYRLVSHNVAYLVPPAEYGESHPEYFALVDGQRKLNLHGGGPQLCMTHPDVLEIVTQAVLKNIAENPGVKNFDIAHMDNHFYCTCANCAAVDAREESHAGATLALVNAVAERIEPLHPEVLISTYAYEYTRKPPKYMRARPNVMIQLCSIECCDFHAIDDPTCDINRAFCEDTDGWKERADHIFVWHYNTNFRNYLLPFPNFRAIGPSVKYFAENHGRGVFMQAGGNAMSAELSDLRNYVMSRCLWKPGRDSWAEMREFVQLHYAEAANPILEYLTWYHDHVGQAGVHPTCFPTESALALDPVTARRIFAYFEQALSLAQNDAVRARVEKASLCAYRAALSAAEMRLVFEDDLCKPDLEGLPGDLLTQFAALCERYGVTMEGETMPISEYLAYVTRLHNGMQAVRLENDTWRVVLLPESNAKLVEMLYKPTGRNVVQPARSLNRFRFEDWIRQGPGPGATSELVFSVEADSDSAVFTCTAEDGTRFERRVSLRDDAVHFAMHMTAGPERAVDFNIHPEYDTATLAADPEVVRVYVRAPEWVHANAGWHDGAPNDAQRKLIAGAAAGGSFAYFNREAGFGVEQRFDPEQMARLDIFWGPSRRQINLEMFPTVHTIAPGETAGYEYTVHYLDSPPK